jgi:hypothetical protein
VLGAGTALEPKTLRDAVHASATAVARLYGIKR